MGVYVFSQIIFSSFPMNLAIVLASQCLSERLQQCKNLATTSLDVDSWISKCGISSTISTFVWGFCKVWKNWHCALFNVAIRVFSLTLIGAGLGPNH